MKSSTHIRFIQTKPDKTIIIIRLLVGCVFLSEGIQKILFAATLGAGRFEKIGLPSAEFLASFVSMVEICCGVLVILGLFTRMAVIPFMVIMVVAMATTKSEIYFKEGFWELMHASRTEWAMLLASGFLL